MNDKEASVVYLKEAVRNFIHERARGYAPVYCIAGISLQQIQKWAFEKGKDIRNFNTYASSLGFPARTIFEKKLKKYII